MAKQRTVITKKRRGPPPTGKGTLIGVRLQPPMLKALDKFIAEHDGAGSRPEAIRRLIEAGLAMPAPTSRKNKRARAEGAALAEKAATERIHRVQRGKGQSDATKAQRKVNLTQIPTDLTTPETPPTRGGKASKKRQDDWTMAPKAPTEMPEDKSAKKLRRAEEGRAATSQYQSATRATDEKTARLRALRLAKEAAEVKTPRTPSKRGARRRKVGPEDEDRRVQPGETGANDD